MTGGEYIIDLEKSANKNLQIKRTNINYGGLEITKTDRYKDLPLAGVGFKLFKYTTSNGWECAYTLADTDSKGKTSSSSNHGGNSSITLENEYGIEVNTKYTIEPGNYYLFEYKNPNPGYNVEFQGRRFINGRGAYIGEIEIKAGEICNANNITYTYTNPNTGKNESIKYTQNEQFGSVYIYKYVETISEDNKIVRNPLEGAKFKLYQNDTAIKIKNIYGVYKDEFISELTNDKVFATVSIEGVPKGTYDLYETGFPSGVNPIIQQGYDSSKDAVKIATITITEDGTASVVMVEDNALIRGTDNKNYAYRSYSVTEKNEKHEVYANIFVTNRKYINVTGFVWEDVPNNKVNVYDDKYNEGATALGGNAYSNTLDVSGAEEKKITDSIDIGMYTIAGSNSVGSVSKSNGNYKITKVDASKLEDYYIIFDYSEYNNDNKYITCAPGLNWDSQNDLNNEETLTGVQAEMSISSKALVNQADIKESDSELIEEANTGSYLGRILKDEGKRKVFFTFINNVPTIQYINLGIKVLPKTSYKLNNSLAKVIISVDKHSFTYTYGDSGVEEAEELKNLRNSNGEAYPKVNWQSKTDYLAYSRSIYPSDITTLNSSDEDKIQVYVTYVIDVTNTTNYQIEKLYCEDSLQLDNIFENSPIKIEYDKSRYTIKGSNILGGYTTDKGYAFLSRDSIKNPIEDNEYVYVQFKVKDEAIIKILNGDTYEDFPTKAITSAFHNYHRTDYFWKWNGNIATESKLENNKHKTISEEKSEEAPYLKFTLSEDRKISGKVFKDICTEDATNNHEVLGDGKYDSNNDKKVSNVKVELLNKAGESVYLYPKSKVLDAYEKDENGNFIKTTKTDTNGTTKSIWKLKENVEFEKAITTTNDDGEYSFLGVLPEEYYLRFTYGNGEQVIKDANNSIVYSNGFKSTIISEDIADTLKSKYSNNALTEEDKLWYLDLQSDYNIAVDNDINNTDSNNNGIPDCFEYDYQVDFRTQNNDNSVKKSKTSDTPLISVPIEFTKLKEGISTTHYSSFDNMSFGIIEKPKVTMKLKKEITNIKLTYNNGQELFNGNPSSNIPYVSNFDNPLTDSGSRNVKVEANNSNIYGATLEVIYTITVENESELTYITEDYYKYGTVPMLQNNKIDESKEAKIYVNSLLEYLDPLLKIKLASNINNNNGEEYTYNDNKKIEVSSDAKYEAARNTLAKKESSNNKEKEDAFKSKYKEVYELGNMNKKQYMINNGSPLRTTNVSNEESETATKLQVVATRILSNENDELDYISYAQLSTVTTAKNAYSDPTAAPLVKVDGEDYWNIGNIPPYEKIPGDSTDITITPATGLNKNMDYYIAGIIVLIALGAVVVCVKKIIKTEE